MLASNLLLVSTYNNRRWRCKKFNNFRERQNVVQTKMHAFGINEDISKAFNIKHLKTKNWLTTICKIGIKSMLTFWLFVVFLIAYHGCLCNLLQTLVFDKEKQDKKLSSGGNFVSFVEHEEECRILCLMDLCCLGYSTNGHICEIAIVESTGDESLESKKGWKFFKKIMIKV